MKPQDAAGALTEAELQAADWFVRHDLGLVTAADAARFRAWLSDRANSEAYAMFRDGWASFEALPAALQDRVVQGLTHDDVCAGWAAGAARQKTRSARHRVTTTTLALVDWLLRWRPVHRFLP